MRETSHRSSPAKGAFVGLIALLALQATARAEFPGLGMYIGDPGGDTTDEVLAEQQRLFERNYEKFVAQVGQHPNLFDAFVDYTYPIWSAGEFDNQWVNSAAWIADIYAFTCERLGRVDSQGRPAMIPILSVGLADNPTAMPGNNRDNYNEAAAIDMMEDITRGEYDARVWNSMLDKFRDRGFKTIYLRIGWEQNGNWYPWQARSAASATAYVKAWRHVADVARTYAQANDMTILTVWSPAIGAVWLPIPLEDTYPGSAYVDIIGPDIYSPIWHPSESENYDVDGLFHDWTTNQSVPLEEWYANPQNRWRSWDYPESGFWSPDRGWGMLAAIDFATAEGKPFGLSETGAGNNGVDTQNGGGPDDEPEFPKYLATRLLESGLPVEFVAIWAITTDENPPGNWGFLDGEKPLQAAAWKQFVIDMGGGQAEVAPSAPDDLTASAASSSRITLSWADNSQNETGFEIERARGSGSFSHVATMDANVTTYRDSSLRSRTTYRYRVRASNGAGASEYSNTASARTR